MIPNYFAEKFVTIQVSFLRMQESPVSKHMTKKSIEEIPAFAGMTGDR
jgi:hypothetical protein